MKLRLSITLKITRNQTEDPHPEGDNYASTERADTDTSNRAGFSMEPWDRTRNREGTQKPT